MIVAEFGTGEVLWSLVWLSLFVLWLWLVIALFTDIMRSEDLSGLARAAWALAIVFLPFLGIVGYLVARGAGMPARSMGRRTRRA
jgi:fatty acid desaturase